METPTNPDAAEGSPHQDWTFGCDVLSFLILFLLLEGGSTLGRPCAFRALAGQHAHSAAQLKHMVIYHAFT